MSCSEILLLYCLNKQTTINYGSISNFVNLARLFQFSFNQNTHVIPNIISQQQKQVHACFKQCINMFLTLILLQAKAAICSFCSTWARSLDTRCWEASNSFLSLSTLSGVFEDSPRLLVDLVLLIFLELSWRLLILTTANDELDVDLIMLGIDPDTDLARFDLDKLLVMSRFTEDVAVNVLFFKFVSWRSELRRCI